MIAHAYAGASTIEQPGSTDDDAFAIGGGLEYLFQYGLESDSKKLILRGEFFCYALFKAAVGYNSYVFTMITHL